MTDAETDADLDRIDRALVGLRHLWSGPLHLQDPALGQVEMSTVWIVNALAHASQQCLLDSHHRGIDQQHTQVCAGRGVS